MIKKIAGLFIVIAVVTLAVSALISVQAKEPKVIDTFSDTFHNNSITHNSTGMLPSTATRKVKYIDAFQLDQNKTNSTAAQDNSTVTPQNNTQEVIADTGSSNQTNSSSQGNATGEEIKIKYKVLKSK